MARTADYKSAFDVIGPIMIGPSSSHTAGAVRMGSAARKVLGDEPENISISYFESFAETHAGHGTDLAIIAGVLDFPTEDPRVKTSIEIAKSKGINIEFIEETGTNVGEHPNSALVRLDKGDKHIEVCANSIGGGTIKVRSIHVNGACALMNHTLPLLVLYGEGPLGEFNRCINTLAESGLNINEEIKSQKDGKTIVALHLHKPIKVELLESIKSKFKSIEFSNII
ncbi:L-serine ammonia-lyase, iron-sulfur-dependent subunit beta [Macrococcus animalis]|uniref:L-serine ammonia-lyase, iron-sulfur-dependent subunit beta n=1 Tax=Macrococcus animalis TaxID=3395467 RepID=UPI0039BE56CA